MTSDKAIISILKEQINTYKLLHGLLKKEREYLVEIDSDRVEQISKEKDTIIMRLRLLEEERIRLIRKYAEDKGLSFDINLDELGKITGDGTFSDLRSQMLSLLQNIDEMNKFNSILIDRSLNYIKTTSKFLNLFNKEHVPQATGVLLSKET